ncbi:MAG: alkylphosphonate utilization protein [Prevotellaceae bacterium]|jgi:protein PhnA|nr:alkylphosphonate utilization protein [Prevotellaceae bacterium]
MEDVITCPACNSTNAYFDGVMYICPDCMYEWSPEGAEEESNVPKDNNGTPLNEGDDVTLIKDLKVKGSSVTLKRGTKVKGIKFTDNPEEVDCRVEGMAIVLKTCFLKKG